MVTKIEEGWKCSICGDIYSTDILAVSCEQSHEYVYVPIKQSDLFRLMQFIITKDDALLTESLMKTLTKYSRKVKG